MTTGLEVVSYAYMLRMKIMYMTIIIPLSIYHEVILSTYMHCASEAVSDQTTPLSHTIYFSCLFPIYFLIKLLYPANVSDVMFLPNLMVSVFVSMLSS